MRLWKLISSTIMAMLMPSEFDCSKFGDLGIIACWEDRQSEDVGSKCADGMVCGLFSFLKNMY